MLLAPRDIEIRHFHLFCGLGGGARGFNRGEARVGHLRARFRCIGGIDVDPAAIADFSHLAGVTGTARDLFSREQYHAFHGADPPDGWREATPDDIRRAAGGERPHIVFGSAPCKGFSGLLSESRSRTARYQALNQLALRGLWLALEAWSDDPPEFFLWENVPRITTRGRSVLDQMEQLLDAYGYAVAETTHDCGELGGLAQRRPRFLLVARHREKVPPFLYEPVKRRVRGVGEAIGKLPVPGPDPILPMHRLPRLQWQTWVRLAFVEAGSDWRSLNRLRVADGVLRDFALVPASAFGEHDGKMRVEDWRQPSHVVTGSDRVGSGALSIADPRIGGKPRFNHVFRIVAWREASPAVTGGGGPAVGLAVADPRSRTGGALCVTDPRPVYSRDGKGVYKTTGEYGVVPWDAPSGAVTSSGQHDNGRWSVADPRVPAEPTALELPKPTDRLVAVIQALDGTYHRPFTTLELALIQSLMDPEDVWQLDGDSNSAWRERIGNAVPPAAAEAIASVMGQTLLLAWSGETFVLSDTPVWVRPVAIALSVSPARYEDVSKDAA